MTVKIHYDAQSGVILGKYPDCNTYSSIPEPYIEIDNATWVASYNKTMQVVNGAFVEVVASDAQKLQDVKNIAISKAKEMRDQLQYANIVYQNSTFTANQIVQDQLTNVIVIIANNTMTWYDINGVSYQWVLADLQNLASAILIRASALYKQYYDFYNAINACTDIDGVNSIKIIFK